MSCITYIESINIMASKGQLLIDKFTNAEEISRVKEFISKSNLSDTLSNLEVDTFVLFSSIDKHTATLVPYLKSCAYDNVYILQGSYVLEQFTKFIGLGL